MTFDLKKVAATALLTAGLVVVYWQTLTRLVDAWVGDGNYSHGFLILPIALYFVWERRARLLATPVRPTWLGLGVFVAGILLLLAGLLGSELFVSRLSL